MKFSLIGLLVIGVSLLGGCASWQGQVASPNTRFAALSKYEPAAIPKDAGGNGSAGTGLAEGRSGAYIPVLGQVVIGSAALNMKRTSRKTFYWQDPDKFVISTPTFTGGTWDNAVTGVLSQEAGNVSNSTGIKLSTDDKGIPLGGGKKITLKFGVDGTVKLTKWRVARLDLTNLKYVETLIAAATTDTAKDAYFVGEVLVCDVNSSDLVGFAVDYVDPGNPTSNPTLKADYEAKYSGVGLVLGVNFNKLSVAEYVSFKDSGQKSTDTLAAIRAPSPSLKEKVNRVTNALRTLDVKNATALEKLYTTTMDSNGNVVLTPENPFIGGTESLLVDKATVKDAKVTLADIGEHQFQYSVVFGNKLYAVRTILVLKSGPNGKVVEETVANRDMFFLKWEGVNPDSVN